MDKQRWAQAGGLLLAGVGLALILLAAPGLGRPLLGGQNLADAPTAIAQIAPAGTTSAPDPAEAAPAGAYATATSEPIVPTRTVGPSAVVGLRTVLTAPPGGAVVSSTHTPNRPTGEPGSTPTRPPTATPTSTPTTSPTRTPTVPPADTLWQGHIRWGISVSGGPITRLDTAPLRPGWYMDWMARRDAPRPGGVEYMPMVRTSPDGLAPDVATIARIARAHPGQLWLIGNEPDVPWQDNVPAATYARQYHDAYAAIKGADRSAQVSAGSISQPTPLRLRYLDAVLASYQQQFGAALPVDVWNIHNYMLREQRDSWGVGIPPGMSDEHGVLYEIADSGNLDLFRQQIISFRRWMAERGYRGRPLFVSEYGIPMPADYGFSDERVVSFWTETFNFFMRAADPALGDPADANHLVQRWCWFTLSEPTYPTGNIYDTATGQITAVGRAWVARVAAKP